MAKVTVRAEPYEYEFDPATTALLVIDMQRDFVEPGGVGEMLGNDISPLRWRVGAGARPRRARPRHRPETSPGAGRAGRGQAREGLVLRDRPGAHPSGTRDQEPAGDRSHDRGLW